MNAAYSEIVLIGVTIVACRYLSLKVHHFSISRIATTSALSRSQSISKYCQLALSIPNIRFVVCNNQLSIHGHTNLHPPTREHQRTPTPGRLTHNCCISLRGSGKIFVNPNSENVGHTLPEPALQYTSLSVIYQFTAVSQQQ